MEIKNQEICKYIKGKNCPHKHHVEYLKLHIFKAAMTVQLQASLPCARKVIGSLFLEYVNYMFFLCLQVSHRKLQLPTVFTLIRYKVW